MPAKRKVPSVVGVDTTTVHAATKRSRADDWRVSMSVAGVDELETLIRAAPSITPATITSVAKLILPIAADNTDADDTSDIASVRVRALMAAHRVFDEAGRRGSLTRTEDGEKNTTNSDSSSTPLIQDQYSAYKDAAISAIRYSPTNALVVAAIQSLMHFVTTKYERQYIRQTKHVYVLLSSPQSLYSRLVEALLLTPHFNDHVFTHFISAYAQLYDDVRYAAIKCIARVIKKFQSQQTQQQQQDKAQSVVTADDKRHSPSSLPTENILSMLLRLTELTIVAVSSSTHEPRDYIDTANNSDNADMKMTTTQQQYNSKDFKQFLSTVWISFLSLPNLPLSVYKRVLMSMSTIIIPAMALSATPSNPGIKTNVSSGAPSSIWLLSDFLVDGYSYGGLLSILALDGLFILITRYGLDYPHYYRHLYALCTAELTMATYRARFFQLLNLSLMSSFIPMTVLTSFVKRLARLALTAPAPAAVSLLAIIHTAMRKHPSTRPLIDKPIKKKKSETLSQEQTNNGEAAAEEETLDVDELDEAAVKENDLTEFIRQRQRELIQAESDAARKQKPSKRKRNDRDEANDKSSKADADTPFDNDNGQTSTSNGQQKNTSNGPSNYSIDHTRNSRCAMDPFDAVSNDPSSTNAHASSLWEVDTLRSHFSPQVASLAQHILTTVQAPLQQPIDTYLNSTYADLFDKELHRRENQHVALADEVVTVVFAERGQQTVRNDVDEFEEEEEQHHFKWTSLHLNWTW